MTEGRLHWGGHETWYRVVGELHEPRDGSLRLEHGVVVLGETSRELREGRRERTGQRGRRTARRRRRPLSERREEVTDSLLVQHGGRNRRQRQAAACRPE